MSSDDYITRLRHELVDAATRERAGVSRQSPWRPPPLRTLIPAAAAAVLVVVALSLAGGGRENDRATVPGQQLSYRAGDADRSAAVLRTRIDAVGLDGVTVRVGAAGTVVVELAADAPPGTRASVKSLTAPGRLRIYDYERNLLTPEPLSLAAARRRADAAKEGAIAVRTMPPAQVGWVALADDPAVTERDVTRATAVTDPATKEPSIAIDFTDAGKTAFKKLTRAVAHRGADLANPGDDPRMNSQHIAVVLDGALVALPRIDYREAPDGIDGPGAQISGGFGPEQTQRLAAILDSGPLPGPLTPG